MKNVLAPQSTNSQPMFSLVAKLAEAILKMENHQRFQTVGKCLQVLLSLLLSIFILKQWYGIELDTSFEFTRSNIIEFMVNGKYLVPATTFVLILYGTHFFFHTLFPIASAYSFKKCFRGFLWLHRLPARLNEEKPVSYTELMEIVVRDKETDVFVKGKRFRRYQLIYHDLTHKGEILSWHETINSNLFLIVLVMWFSGIDFHYVWHISVFALVSGMIDQYYLVILDMTKAIWFEKFILKMT